MRTSDWIVRILIFLLIAVSLYLLAFFVYPEYMAIKHQKPNRPSVSETLNQLDNGKEATLDAEDYEEEEYDAVSKVKEGVAAAGAVVSSGAEATRKVIGKGAEATKDALAKGTEAVGEGAEAAKGAFNSASKSVRERTKEAIASTPSIDDLVTLKEEKAKEFEANQQGSANVDVFNPSGSSSSGNYMIVAGTYRQMINAESELKKLKNLGYKNATIAKFNKSTYASLIVDRFTSSKEAYSYKKVLEGNGLDVYVHKKR